MKTSKEKNQANMKDDDYMDEIFMRRGHRELDSSLHGPMIDRVWAFLKDALSESIGQWNQKCRKYNRPEATIEFYLNASEMASIRNLWMSIDLDGLPEDVREKAEKLRHLPDLGPGPSSDGVCAQTVAKSAAGKPLARVWTWKTDRIHYRHSFASLDPPKRGYEVGVIDIPVEAGVIPEGEERTVREAVKKLLMPVMEVAK